MCTVKIPQSNKYIDSCCALTLLILQHSMTPHDKFLHPKLIPRIIVQTHQVHNITIAEVPQWSYCGLNRTSFHNVTHRTPAKPVRALDAHRRSNSGGERLVSELILNGDCGVT